MEAKHKFFEYWDKLPPWAKGVAFVGTAAVVFISGRLIYKHYKDKKDLEKANQAGVNAQRDLQVLASQGIHPSYVSSQYNTFADALRQAMDGCGTDEQAIYNIMSKMKNDADVLSLISAFAVRYYTPCAASQPVSSIINLFKGGTGYGGSIGDWFGYELTAGEMNKMNGILSTNGIRYQF